MGVSKEEVKKSLDGMRVWIADTLKVSIDKVILFYDKNNDKLILDVDGKDIHLIEAELGEGKFGTKAVVYVSIDTLTGQHDPKVVFLSESVDTHHSQALAELIDTDYKTLIYNGAFSDSKIKQFLPFSFVNWQNLCNT